MTVTSSPKKPKGPAAHARAKQRASDKLADAAGCLTVQEVAQQCDVHRETVKRWIGDKKLKAFKLGGHWRVRPEHVTQYLKAQGAA